MHVSNSSVIQLLLYDVTTTLANRMMSKSCRSRLLLLKDPQRVWCSNKSERTEECQIVGKRLLIRDKSHSHSYIIQVAQFLVTLFRHFIISYIIII